MRVTNRVVREAPVLFHASETPVVPGVAVVPLVPVVERRFLPVVLLPVVPVVVPVVPGGWMLGLTRTVEGSLLGLGEMEGVMEGEGLRESGTNREYPAMVPAPVPLESLLATYKKRPSGENSRPMNAVGGDC
jgi:hypothetical protein